MQITCILFSKIGLSGLSSPVAPEKELEEKGEKAEGEEKGEKENRVEENQEDFFSSAFSKV